MRGGDRSVAFCGEDPERDIPAFDGSWRQPRRERQSFTAPHQALRIMHLGLGAMVPGKPECTNRPDLQRLFGIQHLRALLESFQREPDVSYYHGTGSFSLQE